MNFQWMNQNAACPVVEFHDVRTEKFRIGQVSGAGREPLRPGADARPACRRWASSGSTITPTG